MYCKTEVPIPAWFVRGKNRTFTQYILFGRSNECWPWMSYTDRHGYGIFIRNGKRLRASRIAHQSWVGVIPKGMEACHRCDNPPCVNPNHLFAGTHKDNMMDMSAKGRGRLQRRS